jgi:hypothetical protein
MSGVAPPDKTGETDDDESSPSQLLPADDEDDVGLPFERVVPVVVALLVPRRFRVMTVELIMMGRPR